MCGCTVMFIWVPPCSRGPAVAVSVSAGAGTLSADWHRPLVSCSGTEWSTHTDRYCRVSHIIVNQSGLTHNQPLNWKIHQCKRGKYCTRYSHTFIGQLYLRFGFSASILLVKINSTPLHLQHELMVVCETGSLFLPDPLYLSQLLLVTALFSVPRVKPITSIMYAHIETEETHIETVY